MPPKTLCPNPPSTARTPPIQAVRGARAWARAATAATPTRKGSWERAKHMIDTTPRAPAASMAASRSAGSATNSGWVRTETSESSAVSTRLAAARTRIGRDMRTSVVESVARR
jgi:hypothetical protein